MCCVSTTTNGRWRKVSTGRNRASLGHLLIAVGAVVCVGLLVSKTKAAPSGNSKPLITSGEAQLLAGRRYRITLAHTREAGALYRAALLETFAKHPEMGLELEMPSDTVTIAEATAGQPDPVLIGTEIAPSVIIQSVQEVA